MSPLADSWGMHDGGIGVGWWIVMVSMMLLMMGGMMRGMGGGSSPDSSAPGERPETTESAVEILERRLAEGEISIRGNRTRRAELAHGSGGKAVTRTETLTAPRVREASR